MCLGMVCPLASPEHPLSSGEELGCRSGCFSNGMPTGMEFTLPMASLCFCIPLVGGAVVFSLFTAHCRCMGLFCKACWGVNEGY